MVKNRKFALVFRLAAIAVIMFGLIRNFGVLNGNFYFREFVYYTILSNLLALVMFIMLGVRTESGLREETCSDSGADSGAGYFPRLEMVCAVNLLLTFIVFWTLLAPSIPASYLSSFDNLSVHVITPLALLADYALFSEAGRLKYRDVYFTCVFPLFYLVLVTVLGAKPYFFLDFENTGIFVLAYVGAILLLLILLGHGFYFADKKLRNKIVFKTRKPVLTVAVAVLTLAVCVAAGLVNSRKSQPAIETITLRSGVFLHESGNEEKYIKVFGDGTLQIFGFDFYGYFTSVNGYEEETLKPLCEQLKERGEYSVRPLLDDDGNMSMNISFKIGGIDDNFIINLPCEYIDDFTLEMPDGLYKYTLL